MNKTTRLPVPAADRVRRWVAPLLVVAAGLGLSGFGALIPGARDAAPAAPAQDRPLVYRVPVTGMIEMGLAPFIERSLREAANAGANAVILEIETPGGRVDAAQRIVNALGESRVPTYAYVNRRAISAGAMIALGTNGIYMRTGSLMGAATPVAADGEKVPEKFVSVMRSEMRALAEAHGLDPRIAEAMVDEDLEVQGVIERGKLLTLTADEAEAIGYAVEVADWDEVLLHLELGGAEVRTTVTNWAESLVRFLTHPLITPMLLTLGFLGLIFEIKSPGFGLPGALGLLSLVLFFGSHLLIGLAGWEEVLLLTIGIVLLTVEIFLVPGFGVFGIAGIIGILAAIYMSMISPLATGADHGQAAAVLSSSLLAVLVFGWLLARMLPRSSRFLRSGILLAEATGRATGYISVPAREDLVGASGVAMTALRPAGAARFGDERIDVVAESDWIEAGTPIRVIRSEGYRVVVRPEA